MSEPSPSAPSDAPSDTPQHTGSPPTGEKPATTLGRPRREGNDSLWKRARRTLGTNSLTFLQPQSRPVPGKFKTPTGCQSSTTSTISLDQMHYQGASDQMSWWDNPSLNHVPIWTDYANMIFCFKGPKQKMRPVRALAQQRQAKEENKSVMRRGQWMPSS